MSVHKAQRRALKAFNKSVRTLIENNKVPSIDFKAVELKTRQDAGEMKVAELKKQEAFFVCCYVCCISSACFTLNWHTDSFVEDGIS